MPKILVVPTGSDHWTLTDGTGSTDRLLGRGAAVPAAGVLRCRDRGRSRQPQGRTPVDEGSLAPDTIGEEESARQRQGSRRPLRAGSEPTLVLPMSTSALADAVYAWRPRLDGGPRRQRRPGRILVTMLDAGKVVSLGLRHGPVGLPCRRSAPTAFWLFAGRRLTAPHRRRGAAGRASLTGARLLESCLREAGAASSREAWRCSWSSTTTW